MGTLRDDFSSSLRTASELKNGGSYFADKAVNSFAQKANESTDSYFASRHSDSYNKNDYERLSFDNKKELQAFLACSQQQGVSVTATDFKVNGQYVVEVSKSSASSVVSKYTEATGYNSPSAYTGYESRSLAQQEQAANARAGSSLVNDLLLKHFDDEGMRGAINAANTIFRLADDVVEYNKSIGRENNAGVQQGSFSVNEDGEAVRKVNGHYEVIQSESFADDVRAAYNAELAASRMNENLNSIDMDVAKEALDNIRAFKSDMGLDPSTSAVTRDELVNINKSVLASAKEQGFDIALASGKGIDLDKLQKLNNDELKALNINSDFSYSLLFAINMDKPDGTALLGLKKEAWLNAEALKAEVDLTFRERSIKDSPREIYGAWKEGSLTSIVDALNTKEAYQKALENENLSKKERKDFELKLSVANDFSALKEDLAKADWMQKKLNQNIINGPLDAAGLLELNKAFLDNATLKGFNFIKDGKFDVEALRKLTPAQMELLGLTERTRDMFAALNEKGAWGFDLKEFAGNQYKHVMKFIFKADDNFAQSTRELRDLKRAAKYGKNAVVNINKLRSIKLSELRNLRSFKDRQAFAEKFMNRQKELKKQAKELKDKAKAAKMSQKMKENAKYANRMKKKAKQMDRFKKSPVGRAFAFKDKMKAKLMAKVNPLAVLAQKIKMKVTSFALAAGAGVCAVVFKLSVFIMLVIIVISTIESILDGVTKAFDAVANFLTGGRYNKSVAVLMAEEITDKRTEVYDKLLESAKNIPVSPYSYAYGYFNEDFEDYIEKFDEIECVLDADGYKHLYINPFHNIGKAIEYDESGMIVAGSIPQEYLTNIGTINTNLFNINSPQNWDGIPSYDITTNLSVYNLLYNNDPSVPAIGVDNGHTNNTKDILAMANVMFQYDGNDSSDESIGNILGETYADVKRSERRSFFKNIGHNIATFFKKLFGCADKDEDYVPIINGGTYNTLKDYCIGLAGNSLDTHFYLDIQYGTYGLHSKNEDGANYNLYALGDNGEVRIDNNNMIRFATTEVGGVEASTALAVGFCDHLVSTAIPIKLQRVGDGISEYGAKPQPVINDTFLNIADADGNPINADVRISLEDNLAQDQKDKLCLWDVRTNDSDNNKMPTANQKYTYEDGADGSKFSFTYYDSLNSNWNKVSANAKSGSGCWSDPDDNITKKDFNVSRSLKLTSGYSSSELNGKFDKIESYLKQDYNYWFTGRGLSIPNADSSKSYYTVNGFSDIARKMTFEDYKYVSGNIDWSYTVNKRVYSYPYGWKDVEETYSGQPSWSKYFYSEEVDDDTVEPTESNPNPKTTKYYLKSDINSIKINAKYTTHRRTEKSSYRNCKGHNFEYCGGHVGITSQLNVFSVTNEQLGLAGTLDEYRDCAVYDSSLENAKPYKDEGGQRETLYGEIKGKYNDENIDWSTSITIANSGLYKNEGDSGASPIIDPCQGQAVYKGPNVNVDTSGTWAKKVELPTLGYTEKEADKIMKLKVQQCRDIFDIDGLIRYGWSVFPVQELEDYESWTADNISNVCLAIGQSWDDIYGFDLPMENNMDYADSLSEQDIDVLMAGYDAQYGDTPDWTVERREAVITFLKQVGHAHYSTALEKLLKKEGYSSDTIARVMSCYLSRPRTGTIKVEIKEDGSGAGYVSEIEEKRFVASSAAGSTSDVAYFVKNYLNVNLEELEGKGGLSIGDDLTKDAKMKKLSDLSEPDKLYIDYTNSYYFLPGDILVHKEGKINIIDKDNDGKADIINGVPSYYLDGKITTAAINKNGLLKDDTALYIYKDENKAGEEIHYVKLDGRALYEGFLKPQVVIYMGAFTTGSDLTSKGAEYTEGNGFEAMVKVYEEIFKNPPTPSDDEEKDEATIDTFVLKEDVNCIKLSNNQIIWCGRPLFFSVSGANGMFTSATLHAAESINTKLIDDKKASNDKINQFFKDKKLLASACGFLNQLNDFLATYDDKTGSDICKRLEKTGRIMYPWTELTFGLVDNRTYKIEFEDFFLPSDHVSTHYEPPVEEEETSTP